MLTEYLYKSHIAANREQAVIILPEIYGLKDFARELADKFATELQFTGYALDYFWALTHKPNDFDYQQDVSRGVELMHKMSGEKFVQLLRTAVGRIRDEQPALERLVVVGFCFGGRLAYLSGVLPEVTDIISFYGAGSNQSSFYGHESAISATTQVRQQDAGLRVLGLFGEHDDSIPNHDRQAIEQNFRTAEIPFAMHVYAAGHAFFNEDRTDHYVAGAATAAWRDVSDWLKTDR